LIRKDPIQDRSFELMTKIHKVKKIARFILDTRLWKPSHARLIYRHYIDGERSSQVTNERHIVAALDWLRRAQDFTGTGGVAGRYLLDRGWTDPYPETSGYIVPTLLEAEKRFNDHSFRERTKKIIDFLYSVQMDNGAFPGGEYNSAYKSFPIVFNTGQIMIGLISWYELTGEAAALRSLKRGADWLVAVQEDDGSWEKYTYGTIKTAYHTRVAWPLALYGKLYSDKKSIDTANKFIDWTLKNSNYETGWVSGMDFIKENHIAQKSVTHTLAYTYRGLLEYALLFDRKDILGIVFRASEGIINQFEKSGFISGVLDSRWQNVEKYTCLTGNCQLAIIWLKLSEIFNDKRFFDAADKILNIVKLHQNLNSIDPGIKGGICGSVPIWGDYIRNGYPNWGAKFFIDALMLLERLKSGMYHG